MPTENRRVATYLPSRIDTALEAFKRDRGLKGDSQALILILSEYFQVNSEVAYHSSSQLDQRIAVVEGRLHQLANLMTDRLQAIIDSVQSAQVPESDNDQDALTNELLSELERKLINPLAERMDALEARLDGKQKCEPPTKEVSSQLKLIPQDESSSSHRLGSELLKPLRGVELSERFGCYKNTVDKSRRKLENSPEKFLEWSRSKDPDQVSWQYDPTTKLYNPV